MLKISACRNIGQLGHRNIITCEINAGSQSTENISDIFRTVNIDDFDPSLLEL